MLRSPLQPKCLSMVRESSFRQPWVAASTSPATKRKQKRTGQSQAKAQEAKHCRANRFKFGAPRFRLEAKEKRSRDHPTRCIRNGNAQTFVQSRSVHARMNVTIRRRSLTRNIVFWHILAWCNAVHASNIYVGAPSAVNSCPAAYREAQHNLGSTLVVRCCCFLKILCIGKGAPSLGRTDFFKRS